MPESFANRHHVGQRLARMGRVGQPVDDRYRRVLGELLHFGLRVRTDHDPVEVAREHDRGVLDGFAAAELKVAGREVEAATAELVDPDLERDTGPRRRLLEDHSERAAGEKVVLLAAPLESLELVGELEDLEEVVAAPVGDARERAPLEAIRDGYHAAGCYCGET